MLQVVQTALVKVKRCKFVLLMKILHQDGEGTGKIASSYSERVD